jgi:hypothetical protein
MDVDANGQPDSEAIRRLEEEHRHYSEKLEALLQKPWLSEDEQLEEVRLKKLKLHIKDQLTLVRSQSAPSAPPDAVRTPTSHLSVRRIAIAPWFVYALCTYPAVSTICAFKALSVSSLRP